MATGQQAPHPHTADPSVGVPGVRFLRRMLRYEDFVLFGFTVLVQPLLLKGTGDSGVGDLSNLDPVTALFFLVAFVGAVACLGTRTAGGRIPRIEADDLTPAEWAPYPFLGALALVGSAALDGLAAPQLGYLLGPMAVIGVAAYFGAPKLPTVSPRTRRLFMLPMILAGSSLFGGTMAGIDLFGLGVGLVQVFGSSVNGVVAAILFTVAIPGPFFVMFVFAPRQLADTEGTWGQWVVRYWIYLAGMVLSVWWLRALGV